MFRVMLKPGHPTGVYRRAGIEFSSSGPVELKTVPAAVAKDPWLVVTECAPPSKKSKSGNAEQDD